MQLLSMLMQVIASFFAVNDNGRGAHKESVSKVTVVGIDLGTSYSRVGVFKDGRVEIIPNDQGSHITPSYVAFTPDGERLTGDAAQNQLTSNPENTVFDVKRLIGRTWSDSIIHQDIKYLPFKVIEKSSRPHIQMGIGDGQIKIFAPEEISAMVLAKIKETAEEYLGEKVIHAVVSVPAYFTESQRKATKDAGVIAGLNVIKILNEPDYFGQGGYVFAGVGLSDRLFVCKITQKGMNMCVGCYYIGMNPIDFGCDQSNKWREGGDLILLDVCPRTLGIETDGGAMTALIPRNSVLPVKMSKVFTTTSDNQPTVAIKIYEGDHPLIKNNNLLGTFDLTGIPLAPRGVPQIEVTFDVNVNGILGVIAIDKGTGNMNKITITHDQNQLTPEDIRRMVKDAERFAAKDRKIKVRIAACNELESYAYSLKNQLSDQEKLGGKLSQEDLEILQKVVAEKIMWLESHQNAELEDFQAKRQELEEVVRPIIAKLYGKAGVLQDDHQEKDEF